MLEETIRLSMEIVERFVVNCIFPSVQIYGPNMTNLDPCMKEFEFSPKPHQLQRVPSTQGSFIEQWWKSFNLLPNDWRGLTELWLKETCGPRFTVPLEDQDETFALDYDRVTFVSFLKGIEAGIPRDHLETHQKTYADDQFVDEMERPFYHELNVVDGLAPPGFNTVHVPSLSNFSSWLTSGRTQTFSCAYNQRYFKPVLFPSSGNWSMKSLQAVKTVYQCLRDQRNIHPKDTEQVQAMLRPSDSSGHRRRFVLQDTDGEFDKQGSRLPANSNTLYTENEFIDWATQNFDIITVNPAAAADDNVPPKTKEKRKKKKSNNSLKSSKFLIDVQEE